MVKYYDRTRPSTVFEPRCRSNSMTQGSMSILYSTISVPTAKLWHIFHVGSRTSILFYPLQLELKCGKLCLNHNIIYWLWGTLSKLCPGGIRPLSPEAAWSWDLEIVGLGIYMVNTILHINLKKSPTEELLHQPIKPVPHQEHKLITSIFMVTKQMIARMWKSLALSPWRYKKHVQCTMINENLTEILNNTHDKFLLTWQP